MVFEEVKDLVCSIGFMYLLRSPITIIMFIDKLKDTFTLFSNTICVLYLFVSFTYIVFFVLIYIFFVYISFL